MRFLLAMAFTASYIFAQTPPIFEIRGTITELIHLGEPGELTMPAVPSAYTDGQGQFIFRTEQPGRYRIVVTMPGYSQVLTQAVVDQNHLRADVSISLVRLAEITGRVVDPETREPVPDVPVVAMQRVAKPDGAYSWEPRNARFPGNLSFPGGSFPGGASQDQLRAMSSFQIEAVLQTIGRSNKDGIFTIPGLLPGDYAVSVQRAGPATIPIISTELSTEDPETTDASNISLFWPEGVRNQNVPPFLLGSGSLLNVGTIPLKKATLYRASISIPQGACPRGESVRLSLFSPGAAEISKVVPCGTDVFLRGLESGTYWLYGVSDWQGERDKSKQLSGELLHSK